MLQKRIVLKVEGKDRDSMLEFDQGASLEIFHFSSSI